MQIPGARGLNERPIHKRRNLLTFCSSFPLANTSVAGVAEPGDDGDDDEVDSGRDQSKRDEAELEVDGVKAKEG